MSVRGRSAPVGSAYDPTELPSSFRPSDPSRPGALWAEDDNANAYVDPIALTVMDN
jgi:hypothetical protein